MNLEETEEHLLCTYIHILYIYIYVGILGNIITKAKRPSPSAPVQCEVCSVQYSVQCIVQRTLDLLLHLHRLRCSTASTTVHPHHPPPPCTVPHVCLVCTGWPALRLFLPSGLQQSSVRRLASEICSSAYIHEQPCRSLSFLSRWRSCWRSCIFVVVVSLCRRRILLLGVVDYRSSKGSIFGVSLPLPL